MHIILTHEQADFDALAAMLAARLLDRASLPVLPRRLNRNVQAFLTLYGLDLPFVDPRDLPKGEIKRITLVDTQGMTSLKGMSASTHVQVIDHHSRRDDLPDAWEIICEDVGAATTLLVEALQTRESASMSVLEATLLLLGIYEDTGSLTYTRTTPRDVYASAFLLEQGADLQIAADFLNHPLSIKQQKIFEQLYSSYEAHNIHGNTVVVACGDAIDVDEELSSVAHKLRDVLDPDGLILLIDVRGGVQLVARSTSDYVDVGQIARHFNGGGHARASAALVNDGKRDQIYDQLIGILPKYVRPIAKVAEIMSREPQLLPPDTTAKEAAEQMQRYGYEGYPIVENDRVVGLLTRTQVDRALGHKMNLAVDQLMKAGDVVIQADASVEDLQKLMTETGWGQIPVVDPETGKIIGIVTRTDLLKTLEPRKTSSGPQSVSARLENAFPRMHLELLKMVAACADQQQAALYIVGGFVRDLLLERPSLDYDLVVEGDAIQLGKTLAGKYGGRLVTHGRFGTAKWQLQDARGKLQELFGGEDGSLPETLDLVSARREFYSRPTALPTVEPGGIKLDLHRRDFTINTMALRLDGKYYGDLYDYWGGLADLRKGLVRILHSLSFVDDPTRILRAVRFEKRFDFKIEERTLELLKAALPLLDRVSGDRLRHELDSIFAEEKCIAMLSRLFALNILPAVYSEVSWDAKVEGWMRLLPGLTGNDEWAISPSDLGGYSLETSLGYIFLFGRMNQKQIADINKRLKLPGSIAKTILSFASLRAEIDSLADAPPSTVFVRLQDIPKITLFAVYLTAENDKSRALLYTFITAWAKIKPTIDGHDLRARGLSPGPEYSKILERLRAAWLDEEISSPEEENALLEKLIHG